MRTWPELHEAAKCLYKAERKKGSMQGCIPADCLATYFDSLGGVRWFLIANEHGVHGSDGVRVFGTDMSKIPSALIKDVDTRLTALGY